MKQAMNFRLSKHTITVLSLLAESLQLSKTEIVEKALQLLYEIETAEQSSPLMNFAGILNDDEADEMLKAIYNSRIDSNRKIEL